MVQPAYEHQSVLVTTCWKRAEFRSAVACALGWLLASLLVANSLLAQENAGVSSAPNGFSDPDQAANSTQGLIIRTIRDADPKTPARIVKFADALLDANAYDDVRYLMIRLEQLRLTDEQAYQLIEEVGSDFFLEVFSVAGVQPEGRQVAGSMLAAANRAARAPARIQGLIRNLSSPDLSAQRQAMGRLETLGEPAVAELLNVFADDSRKAEFDAIRQAVVRLGNRLTAPLLGAARASQPKVKLEAIRALTMIPNDDATDVLMWSYLAPNHPEVLQKLSLQALSRRGLQPDAAAIEQRFFRRAFQYVQGKVAQPISLDRKVSVWHWDQKQNRLSQANVDPETAVRLTAARHAASLYEINPDSTRNRAIYLLTQLERAKRLVTPAKPISVSQVVAGLNTNAREINTILSQAVRLRLYPAAMACCEILKETGDTSLLYRANGEPSALVEALASGDRYLQFAAFEAISQLDPQQAYVGSSFVTSFAVYLAQSRNLPVALMGHRRPDLAQTYAASVSTAGIAGQPAVTSRELFEQATSDPDVEMVLISDTLSRPGYRSLIDQLRNDWRTRRLPIALLYSDMDQGHSMSRRMDDDKLFIAVPFSSNPEIVATNVDRLIHRLKPFRVSRVSRKVHAKAAIRWLEKVARDYDTYGFYELANHEQRLQKLLFVNGFESAASEILASLGTHDAQRQLVNFASQSSLPIEHRQKAAEAFAKAVKERGTMLTTVEIKAQYDRLENSNNEPENSRQVLSFIVDAIETRHP